MIKYLVKVCEHPLLFLKREIFEWQTCDIGDASTGTLSSYAYIIMLIHFLQQIRPSVLPVLQQVRFFYFSSNNLLNNKFQLNGDPTKKDNIIRECNKWNVYFYDDLAKLVFIKKPFPVRFLQSSVVFSV